MHIDENSGNNQAENKKLIFKPTEDYNPGDRHLEAFWGSTS